MAVKLNTHAHLIGEPETYHGLPRKRGRERKTLQNVWQKETGFALPKSSEMNNPSFRHSNEAPPLWTSWPFYLKVNPSLPNYHDVSELKSKLNYTAQIADASAAL